VRGGPDGGQSLDDARDTYARQDGTGLPHRSPGNPAEAMTVAPVPVDREASPADVRQECADLALQQFGPTLLAQAAQYSLAWDSWTSSSTVR